MPAEMDATDPTSDRLDAVRELLEAGNLGRLKDELSRLDAWETARIVTGLDSAEQKRLLLLLGPGRAADVVEEMPEDDAARALSGIAPAEAADVVERMDSNEGADLLQTLPQDRRSEILGEMEPEERKEAMELLSYPKESAGGLMMKEFISFQQGTSVREALEDLRRNAQRYSGFSITYMYVTDRAGMLQGVLRLRDLILTDGEVTVESFMIPNPVTVPADMDQEEVARVFEKYHYLAVPVVDPGGRILGVISQDDVLEVVEREASEDLLKFSGIVGGEETHDMPFFRRARRRFAWLSINIILNFVAASVIWMHESTLMAVIGIAMFLPIISDMSGCSGNQAIAVAIRELGRGRIAPRDFLKVWWAEVSVGLLNGFLLGLELGFIAWLWKDSLALALVVGGALWANTVLSMSIGSLVPLLLHKLGKDPALASAPILTTLTDLCGFILILSLASTFLVPGAAG